MLQRACLGPPHERSVVRLAVSLPFTLWWVSLLLYCLYFILRSLLASSVDTGLPLLTLRCPIEEDEIEVTVPTPLGYSPSVAHIPWSRAERVADDLVWEEICEPKKSAEGERVAGQRLKARQPRWPMFKIGELLIAVASVCLHRFIGY